MNKMIEGYCTPMVASPGDWIDFRVSATSNYEVTFVRLKEQEDGSVGLPLSEPFPVTGGEQDRPSNPPSTGCGWNTSFPKEIPLNWRSGIYAARCVGRDADSCYIIFIVRPDISSRGEVAVLANTLTWNAYEGWPDGKMKYADYDRGWPGAATCSFERPFPVTSPVDDGEVNHLTRAELWVLNWLEDSGYAVDVYADTDFHNGIDGIEEYRVLILSTHPEYWSIRMLDNLDAYLAGGGSLAYLGGNGVFECCEPSDDGKAAVYWGGDPSQGRERNFLRNLHPPRPEREILGVAFLFNNWLDVPAKPGPYMIENSAHRFFDMTVGPTGARLAEGDIVGRFGRNYRAKNTWDWGAASGWEVDVSDDADASDDVDVNAWLTYYDANGVRKVVGSDRGRHPGNLELLGRGMNEQPQGPVSAHMTCYRHPGGGNVFAVGSLTFGGSLAVDSNLQQIVRNMLNEALGRDEDANDGVIYAIEPVAEPLVRINERTGSRTGGRLLWYRHLGATDGRFTWEGPNTVGKGWDFRHVFSADDRVIYGIDVGGSLFWYRHLGRDDGTFTWQGPKGQSSRWDFRHVFSGGDGVIYAVESMVDSLVRLEERTGPPTGGRLLWYRHLGWADGSDQWAEGPKTVGNGWDFIHVFAGGEGVIYAITADGELFWYRHLGRADGRFVWDGPRSIGHGWDFAHVFSTGDGVIYAVESMVDSLVRLEERTGPPTGGRLLWYRHLGWMDGTDSWADGPKTVGKGWQFDHAFG